MKLLVFDAHPEGGDASDDVLGLARYLNSIGVDTLGLHLSRPGLHAWQEADLRAVGVGDGPIVQWTLNAQGGFAAVCRDAVLAMELIAPCATFAPSAVMVAGAARFFRPAGWAARALGIPLIVGLAAEQWAGHPGMGHATMLVDPHAVSGVALWALMGAGDSGGVPGNAGESTASPRSSGGRLGIAAATTDSLPILESADGNPSPPTRFAAAWAAALGLDAAQVVGLGVAASPTIPDAANGERRSPRGGGPRILWRGPPGPAALDVVAAYEESLLADERWPFDVVTTAPPPLRPGEAVWGNPGMSAVAADHFMQGHTAHGENTDSLAVSSSEPWPPPAWPEGVRWHDDPCHIDDLLGQAALVIHEAPTSPGVDRALLATMACGACPLVLAEASHAVPGWPRVAPLRTGLVCAPHRSALVSALRYAQTHPELVMKLGSAAHAAVSAHTPERAFAALLPALRGLLGSD